MTNLPRRAFLLSALSACGAPFLSGRPAAGAQLPAAPNILTRGAQTAASFFGTAAVAREIGEAFLDHVQSDRDPESIRAATAGTLDLISAAKTRQAALTALVRAVRTDFREGRIIELHGWVLSRTEAELCALALLPPQ